MASAEIVPPIIRNQRYRRWPVLLVVGALCLSCIGAWLLYDHLEHHMPGCTDGLLALGAGLYTIASCVAAWIVIDRQLPVTRLILDDGLWGAAVGQVPAEQIRSLRFAPDPDEDYVESRLPIRVCELTVELRRRRLRLIVSSGDAARLRDWAERKGIAVRDPGGYSTRRGPNEVT